MEESLKDNVMNNTLIETAIQNSKITLEEFLNKYVEDKESSKKEKEPK